MYFGNMIHISLLNLKCQEYVFPLTGGISLKAYFEVNQILNTHE